MRVGTRTLIPMMDLKDCCDYGLMAPHRIAVSPWGNLEVEYTSVRFTETPALQGLSAIGTIGDAYDTQSVIVPVDVGSPFRAAPLRTPERRRDPHDGPRSVGRHRAVTQPTEQRHRRGMRGGRLRFKNGLTIW
jgi:hypothetical protein